MACSWALHGQTTVTSQCECGPNAPPQIEDEGASRKGGGIHINRKLIPIKAHYFCFLGCMAPIFPFLVVVGVQLGIPVSLSGTLMSISLLCVLMVKPAIAAMVDTFPAFRRNIFLLNLAIMVIFLSAMYFVPPLRDTPRLQGHLMRVSSSNGTVSSPLEVSVGEDDASGDEFLLLAKDDGTCHVTLASECLIECWGQGNCTSTPLSRLIALTSPEEVDQARLDKAVVEILELPGAGKGSVAIPSSGVTSHIYWLEGLVASNGLMSGNVSVVCGTAEWTGPGCSSVLSQWEFWVFAIMVVMSSVTSSLIISITDAIIVDSVGKDGDYGSQRAWGTVGWGLMGPVSGFLVDWWSGSSLRKNLAPSFLLCFILGTCDVILSAVFLKVPEIKSKSTVLKEVWPIFKQPSFFIFCIFVIFSGAFDGFCCFFVLVMEEDMAKGTSAMDYIKLLQGLTLFVQCAVEAPFMFINQWFMRTLGPKKVTSLVFFLYIFRMLALAAVGAWGPVWAVLPVELFNGPCYGLGYTAIVEYSSSVAPRGTSTTIQSLVNSSYEGIGYGLSLFVGGLLFAALGGPGLFLVLAITAAVTFILYVVSLKVLPPLKIDDEIQEETVAENGVKSTMNETTVIHRKNSKTEMEEEIEKTHF